MKFREINFIDYSAKSFIKCLILLCLFSIILNMHHAYKILAFNILNFINPLSE